MDKARVYVVMYMYVHVHVLVIDCSGMMYVGNRYWLFTGCSCELLHCIALHWIIVQLLPNKCVRLLGTRVCTCRYDPFTFIFIQCRKDVNCCCWFVCQLNWYWHSFWLIPTALAKRTRIFSNLDFYGSTVYLGMTQVVSGHQDWGTFIGEGANPVLTEYDRHSFDYLQKTLNGDWSGWISPRNTEWRLV